jgi:predicted MFS family arabinose efflux permease
VPLSSILSEGGEWHVVFYLAAVMAILAGVLAVVVLKPMRQREIAALGRVDWRARGGVRGLVSAGEA